MANITVKLGVFLFVYFFVMRPSLHLSNFGFIEHYKELNCMNSKNFILEVKYYFLQIDRIHSAIIHRKFKQN